MLIFCFIIFFAFSPISCLRCAHYEVRPDQKELQQVKSPTVSVECVSGDDHCVNMLIPTKNTTILPSQWLGCSWNVSDAVTDHTTYHLEPNCSQVHNNTHMLANFLDDTGSKPIALAERVSYFVVEITQRMSKYRQNLFLEV